jgi:hypothetical protein
MNRNFYLVLGAGALLALAACTVTETTTGTGGSGGTTTTNSTGNTGGSGNVGNTGGSGGVGNTGGGGGASCINCADWITSCASACADPATICAGAATDAYNALAECACGECLTDCPEDVCPGGTGAGGGDACGTCQTAAVTGAACSTELGACSGA